MTDDHKLNILGTTGLKESGGYIYEEFLPRLQQQKGNRLYHEMINNSSVIGATRFLIRSLARQVEWRVEPANETEEAREQAEFIEGALQDMSHTFEDLISEVLSFLDFGWSYFETIYKIRKGETKDPTTRSQFDDGKWGWRKIEIRGQDTLQSWEFDPEDAGLLGMYQLDTYRGKDAFIPIWKALLFRTETYKGNPEGKSIYRNAVIDYHNLKRASQIELVGFERDMTGLLTMEVPLRLLHDSAGPNEKRLKNDLEKMLSELKRDEREFAMVPPELDVKGKPTGFKLKLLSSGGRRQFDSTAIKNYYKLSILQSVLAHFVQTGMENVGSFALISSQTNFFALAFGTFLDIIASVFNRYGIPRLLKLNNVPTELHPELVHGDIETPPLDEIARYITALAGAGFDLSDPALERKLLEFASLPQPKEDDEHH